MKTFFLLVMGLSLTTAICSQPRINLSPWFEGTIQLKSDQIVKGKIHYNQELNVVLCQTQNQLKAYSAFLVDNFTFYDDGLNLKRTFKAYQTNDLYKLGNRQFLEEIISGRLIFLRRKRHEINPFGLNGLSTTKEEDYLQSSKFYVYFIMKDDEMIKIKNFRRQINKLTSNAGEEYQEFLNAVDLNKVYNQARAINYYNYLVSQSAVLE